MGITTLREAVCPTGQLAHPEAKVSLGRPLPTVSGQTNPRWDLLRIPVFTPQNPRKRLSQPHVLLDAELH